MRRRGSEQDVYERDRLQPARGEHTNDKTLLDILYRGQQHQLKSVNVVCQQKVTMPGRQQNILTLPSGQRQIVTLATDQPHVVVIVGEQQKLVTIDGTIQQQHRQIMLQQATTPVGTLASQRPKPVALQPKPNAQAMTIDSSDMSSKGLQDLMCLDDDLIIECETVDLDDDDARGQPPFDTSILVHFPDDSDGSLSKEQQKANHIIAEAIAKAVAEGKDIPKVVTVLIDGFDGGGGTAEKKSKKKKEPRPPKERKHTEAGIGDMDGSTQRRSSRQAKRKKYADAYDTTQGCQREL